MAREQLFPYTPASLFFGAGDDQRFLQEETGTVTEVGMAFDALNELCDKLEAKIREREAAPRAFRKRHNQTHN